MTRDLDDLTTIGTQPDEGTNPQGIQLPLVTVIVVNYNYGRFLNDAVGSVFGQSYARVECIVVDNASQDESHTVLADLKARHPSLIVIHRPTNDGQTPASLDGLAAASGHYVVFVDADDFLLPHCIETHIFVHLSMRQHVGFTSGDMLQVVENEIVVTNGEESGRYIRGGRGRKPKLVRPYTGTPDWPSAAVRHNITDKIHYAPPLATKWIWSPTSGLCYRRDSLALFADNARLRELRTGTDVYFAVGCGGLSGSILIDEPLFAYRIHGRNIFSARAQLDRTLNYAVGGHGDNNTKAQLYLVDHVVEKAERFGTNIWLRANLLVLLFKLDLRDNDPSLPAWARRSRAAQALARHFDSFAATVGPWTARLSLLWFAKSVRSPRRLAKALEKKI